MLAALTLLLAVTTASSATVRPAGAATPTDPPIRLTLSSSGRYVPGDRARVYVQSAEDGYLVVLRTDMDGYVRVLYPVDPSDDNFVRGGHRLEIRGRGDREAFGIGRATGTGTILAARAREPFHFDRLTRSNHWDYRKLDSLRAGADPERTLLDIAQQMAGDVEFDYDVVRYSVDDVEADARPAAPHGDPAWGYGYPYPYWPSYYYDPFFYDPFFFGFHGATIFGPPFFFRPFCFGCFRTFVFVNFGRPVLFVRPFAPFVPFRPRLRGSVFARATLGFANRPVFGSRVFWASAAARLAPATRGAPLVARDRRPAFAGGGMRPSQARAASRFIPERTVAARQAEFRGRAGTLTQPLYRGGRAFGGGMPRSFGGWSWGGRGGGGGRRGR